MPTETKAVVPEAGMFLAAFVAPPRTIGDIAAILDAEKPDQMKIEVLKTTADNEPPAGASRGDLARFYHRRGNARAQLGRVNEAIEDANKAMEIGRGAVEVLTMGDLRHFAGL